MNMKICKSCPPGPSARWLDVRPQTVRTQMHLGPSAREWARQAPWRQPPLAYIRLSPTAHRPPPPVPWPVYEWGAGRSNGAPLSCPLVRGRVAAHPV
jgi:hypothetical protein